MAGHLFCTTALAQSTYPIQHVVIIMQENRSFDHYFGTFPGADGIPAGTCVPFNPKKPSDGCLAPFHSQLDTNAGGPHSATASMIDLDDGVNKATMDGFIYEQANPKAKGSSSEVIPDRKNGESLPR